MDAKSPNPNVQIQPIDEDVRKVFERFDANGDGKISASELGDVLSALGSTTSPDELQHMVAELDINSDGFISLNEFAAFWHSTTASAAGGSGVGGDASSSELRDAFELYDQNHNGQISATELHLVLNRLKMNCSIEDCERMISSVDSDGDGNVSFEEFKKMMNSKGSMM